MSDVKKDKNNDFLSSIFEWLEMIITALVTMAILTVFFFRTVSVEGPSMEKTLYTGQRLIVSTLAYTPQNGDIVVVYPRNYHKALVKRVIAVGGQSLNIDFVTGDVTVDGKLLDEKYINNRTTNDEGGEIPSIIPEGYCFIMGDNRHNSSDSRDKRIGLVSYEDVVGKVVWRFFPLNKFGSLYD